MRARCAAAMLLGGGALLAACESGFDRNDQIVNSVRILGVRAHVLSDDGFDWADAQVGDTVQLSALVTNPADVPSVTVTWLACLPTGQLTPCADEGVLRDPTALIPMASDPTKGVILLGLGDSIDYTIPAEAQPLLDAVVARADQNPQAQCSLFVEFPLIVIAQGSDGEVFTATKNVRLSPWSQIGPDASDPALRYYIRNQNPTVTAFDLDPPDMSACGGQALTVSCRTEGDCAAGTMCIGGFCTPQAFPDGLQTVCPVTGQSQSYYDCGLGGPELDTPDDGPNVAEQPSATWYTTAGSISGLSRPNGGTGSNAASRTYTDFTRAAGSFTLYGVVRDGRDGEAWIAQDFQ
jgi:hypothetical protein